MSLRVIFLCLLCLISYSCSKDKPIYEPSTKNDPYKLYQEGLNAVEKNDYFFANKKFSEAELNFTDPDLAAKSAIMSSFSLYAINFYEEAETNLERYLKNYPADKNNIYANYLLAIIYFEQISDEKKDMKPLLKASKKIDFFLKKYPNSEYSIDLKFKKDLIRNQLAAKELYVAKFYISVQKWVPAINRLKIILEDYQTTIFVEEALHRLVEVHYHLGLEEEANKYAKILGYNYNSGEWYNASYKILNKNYDDETNKLKKNANKEKDNLFDKIFKIFR